MQIKSQLATCPIVTKGCKSWEDCYLLKLWKQLTLIIWGKNNSITYNRTLIIQYLKIYLHLFIVNNNNNNNKEKKNNYENFQFIINNTTLEMNSLSQVSTKEKKMKLRNSYGLYRFNTLV